MAKSLAAARARFEINDYPPVPELVVQAEMAALFGCSDQWVYQMRYRKILPAPDGYTGRNPYWIKQRILDWWAINPHKTGGKDEK